VLSSFDGSNRGSGKPTMTAHRRARPGPAPGRVLPRSPAHARGSPSLRSVVSHPLPPPLLLRSSGRPTDPYPARIWSRSTTGTGALLASRLRFHIRDLESRPGASGHRFGASRRIHLPRGHLPNPPRATGVAEPLGDCRGAQRASPCRSCITSRGRSSGGPGFPPPRAATAARALAVRCVGALGERSLRGEEPLPRRYHR
jgi:hypothetical protein